MKILMRILYFSVNLKSGGEVYHDKANAYSTMPAIMELSEEMIAEQGGKSIWFAVEGMLEGIKNQQQQQAVGDGYHKQHNF